MQEDGDSVEMEGGKISTAIKVSVIGSHVDAQREHESFSREPLQSPPHPEISLTQ